MSELGRKRPRPEEAGAGQQAAVDNVSAWELKLLDVMDGTGAVSPSAPVSDVMAVCSTAKEVRRGSEYRTSLAVNVLFFF